MWRGWLLLPILLPVLGGIGVLGIHTLRVRRRQRRYRLICSVLNLF